MPTRDSRWASSLSGLGRKSKEGREKERKEEVTEFPLLKEGRRDGGTEGGREGGRRNGKGRT